MLNEFSVCELGREKALIQAKHTVGRSCVSFPYTNLSSLYVPCGLPAAWLVEGRLQDLLRWTFHFKDFLAASF